MTLERFVSWTFRHGRILWIVALPASIRTAWLYLGVVVDTHSPERIPEAERFRT